MMTFKLLGTGAGPGTPAFYCECEGCLEAALNKKAVRTRTCAHIAAGGKDILLDASPDIRAQMLSNGIKKVDAIFMTHWHWDHFGGLGEFEYYEKLHTKKPIDIYVLPESAEGLNISFYEMAHIFNIIELEFFKTVQIAGVAITPLPAIHSIETAGFLVDDKALRIAYFPDTAGLSGETMDAISGVDVFVCDSSFFGANLFPKSHMTAHDTATLGHKIKAKKTVLTHHAIHYSEVKTIKDMEEYIQHFPETVIAFDGMTFSKEQ